MMRTPLSINPRMLKIKSYSTREEARKACVLGWNLRCNRCGQWGAIWYEGMRPGWGSLALCGQDAAAVREEMQRYAKAMAELVKVNFEQPIEVSR